MTFKYCARLVNSQPTQIIDISRPTGIQHVYNIP